jgi:hypothetical protein
VAADGLLVNLGTNNDVTVTGTVTEASGAAIKTAVELLDNAVSGTSLRVVAPAVQDTGNSTTATLGGGANFTGTAFDLDGYSTWSVNIFSDVASAANGLDIQWSDDATNWDFTDQTTSVAAVGNMITFGRKARYVRLFYTNGAGAQATFRVTAYAQPVAVRQTRKFVGTVLTDADTGQVVVAALQGHTTAGGGAWVDVKVNPSGSLSVVEDSGAAIATSLAILDDWDETDRAKVNVIVGQAGIAAGAGAVGVTVPRVTLASDDPAVTALQVLDNAISGSEMQVDVVGALPAGDNNIGNMDVVTLPALVAGTALIGKISAGLDVSNAYNGATALVPKFESLSTASTGNQALVAAVADKTIRVLSLQIIATASTNAIYINDATADLYGDSTRKIPLDVTGATGPGGITLDFNPFGWFQTAAVNRPININLGSANGLIAICTYVEV